MMLAFVVALFGACLLAGMSLASRTGAASTEPLKTDGESPAASRG